MQHTCCTEGSYHRYQWWCFNSESEVKVKGAQSCPTLYDPTDCSPPGSYVRGDSPGTNTGVGCHALLQGIYPAQGLFHNSESRSVVSNSLRPHGLYSSWNSPGQHTGVGSFSLLQGIFPTQGSKPGLPLCTPILYQLSHKRSPRLLEWVAYPFSSGYS